MNSIVKSLREQAFELLQNQPISKLANLMEYAALAIESKTATNDRQALMIYAKDLQIAELTRMLFTLGKQDGQTIRTQAAEIAQLTAKLSYAYEALESVK